MDARNNIATDLFYKIRSRFSGLKLGGEAGQITINPEEARFFDFDYMEGKTAIGHVSISLAEPNSMKVYFSNGITEAMDGGQKDNWYGFLKELRVFAKRRLLNFDTRDIAKDNLDKRDYAFLSQSAQPKPSTQNTIQTSVGESIMSESQLYGTKTVSYQKLENTRLIIKHSQALSDDLAPGARSRNIAGLFVENQEGERFKYPFIHLAGARAMQRHVANSGLPYDDIGKSIIGMSEEIAQLKSFGNYVVRNDLMNSMNNSIVERSTEYLNTLREQIKALSKQSHYQAYKETFQAQTPMEVPQDVVEDFTEQFTVKNFKEDIKSVFPVLYRLMQVENNIGYNDIVAMTSEEEIQNEDSESSYDPFAKFEQWAMALGEESAIQSQDPEEQQTAIQSLQALVSQAFPVGVDGSNALESLKGIIDDPQLAKQIEDQSVQDPELDARGLVQGWLQLYAPEVLEQLDFGDFDPNAQAAEEPAAEEPAAVEEPVAVEPAPEEVPQESADGPKKSDVPAYLRKQKGGDDWKTTGKDIDDEKYRNISHKDTLARNSGKKESMNVQEVAEFIHSFYDQESGTFPKGPEGVAIMVGKKFGEQAEHAARKMVERMAPQQADPQIAELARIRELSGMPQQEVAVDEGSAHDWNVVRAYEKSGNDQKKITSWLKKEAGLPKDAKVYFDDADLVLDSETIVPSALVDTSLKMKDLLSALAQAVRQQAVRDTDVGENAMELENIRRLSGIAQGLGM